MKKIIACCLVQLFYFPACSQYPIYTLMPGSVSGVVFGDTLLNTRALLQREGIRQITAVQTVAEKDNHSSFTTTYTLTNGRIDSRAWCFRRSPDTAFRFCHHDTLLYNDADQLVEYRAGDSKEPFAIMRLAYSTDGYILSTWITKDPQRARSDTGVYRYRYNGKGQVVRSERLSGRSAPVNASVYYNEDGHPDSVCHDNPQWGAYVFKRKNNEITLETHNSLHRWRYNARSQCLSSYWSFKKRPHASGRPLYSEVSYAYNKDGTLAKVVERSANDRVTTTVYAYSK